MKKTINKNSGKIADKQRQFDNFHCERNEQVGGFKVFDRNEDEVILGMDDRHLNFRVSLLKEKDNNNSNVNILSITTVVAYNNILGWLYFLIVKPFHKIVVPIELKAMVNDLQGIPKSWRRDEN
ncbi:MAG: DUF2867 domain-containing protein [Spirochaetales bacterium]|jgi:hypothetical protein|nr:DUF2867 domain-containing protein [Spirochaetales bacterium]